MTPTFAPSARLLPAKPRGRPRGSSTARGSGVLWFGVWGLGFKGWVSSLGFKGWGLGFRDGVWGLGITGWGLGFRVLGLRV